MQVSPEEVALQSSGEWELFNADDLPVDWWDTWDKLNDEHLEGHPLLNSQMVRRLVAYFGSSGLRAARYVETARPRMQLVLEPNGLGRWRVFAPAQAPVGLLVFDRANGASEQTLRGLLRALSPYALAIVLPYQDAPYSCIGSSSGRVGERDSIGTTICVDTKRFDEYWSNRPRDLRQNIRRYLKRVEQTGRTVRLTATHARSEIAAGVERYGLLESQGWKGREGTALHPDNAQGKFYSELLTELAGRGSAEVSELYLGEQLAASRLLIAGPTMIVMLKTTYDETLRDYAVGRLHLHMLIGQLLSAPERRRIEFYTRANADLLAWSTHTREMANIQIFRNRAVRTLAAHRQRFQRRWSTSSSGGGGG